MTKRWKFAFWNDWRWVSAGLFDVTMLRFNVYRLSGCFVSVDAMLLGFGGSLTRYTNPEAFPAEFGRSREDGEVIGREKGA